MSWKKPITQQVAQAEKQNQSNIFSKVEDVAKEETKPAESKKTIPAITIYKKKNVWYVVRVDAEEGGNGVKFTELCECLGRQHAIERYKIESAKMLLLGEYTTLS